MKVSAMIPRRIKSSAIYRILHPQSVLRTLRGSESVFSEIYAKNMWGGAPGAFYSGSGSRGKPALDYVDLIKNFIADHGIESVIDLGCGDFFIGRQIAESCARYTGVDVAPRVIEGLSAQYGTSEVNFLCLDITQTSLPPADLCLVRQVFQHLSNRQIKAVLKELKKYRYVVVTEHFPHPTEMEIANKDKSLGVGTRVSFGSAVVLDEEPFCVPCTPLLEVGAPQRDDGVVDAHTRGTIRTVLLDMSKT